MGRYHPPNGPQHKIVNQEIMRKAPFDFRRFVELASLGQRAVSCDLSLSDFECS
jgi:hypothetical protein